jgi:hypothetical protein
MSSRHRVALHEPHRSPRAEKAKAALCGCLPDNAVVSDTDETGTFEVEIDAEDREDALHTVWNAMASCGGDDMLIFAEHADVPEHWKARPDGPTA